MVQASKLVFEGDAVKELMETLDETKKLKALNERAAENYARLVKMLAKDKNILLKVDLGEKLIKEIKIYSNPGDNKTTIFATYYED